MNLSILAPKDPMLTLPRLRLLIAALVAVLAAMVACGALSAAAQASPAVPQGFVGIDADGPLFGPDTTVNLDSQVSSMVANGVQSMRVAFDWSVAQPYQSWSQVPSDQLEEFTNTAGAPTDFQQTDQIVAADATRGVNVLPTVLYVPGWDSRIVKGVHLATPRTDAPYAAYLTALVGRYGPNGSFWRQNPSIPKRPIRDWQIWNEPNTSWDWPQPFAASYVALLRSAHAAIKRADPGAKVVLGALTNVTWRSWGQINRIKGSSKLYDVVSVDAFTKYPSDVILALRLIRLAMDKGRVHKPLLATEVSWPSALGKTAQHYDWDTTEAGQARDIAALLPMLAAKRRRLGLMGFDYYSWMGAESKISGAFDYAGLLAFRQGKVVVKPALAAFRRGALALEHCKRKGASATSCIN